MFVQILNTKILWNEFFFWFWTEANNDFFQMKNHKQKKNRKRKKSNEKWGPDMNGRLNAVNLNEITQFSKIFVCNGWIMPMILSSPFWEVYFKIGRIWFCIKKMKKIWRFWTFVVLHEIPTYFPLFLFQRNQKLKLKMK